MMQKSVVCGLWNGRYRLPGLAFLILTLSTPNVEAIDLFGDALPQATTNTCQSYAMVLALAVRGDPAFRVNKFSELRAAEASFRQIANETPGGPYGHDALKIAVSKFTNGKSELKIEERTDIVQWMARVKELTSFKSSRDAMIAALTGKSFPVILTSVTKIGESSYGDGHIITVLGIAGSGLSSTSELVAFNSAIKGGGVINRCEPGSQPGDQRYTAGVMSTNDFNLKNYGNSYRIIYLMPK